MSEVYIAYHFIISPLELGREILIAELGYAGFESFVETPKGTTAYIQKPQWHQDILADIAILKNDAFSITYTREEIAQINWNAEWEKNFDPIVVDNHCMVRAPFHASLGLAYEIVIEPKMSFGTGHHQTTHMMIQHILAHDFTGKTVLDMGSGTGVLAILAEKKGATYLEAIDIDNWCYVNALENIERNNATKIKALEGDASLLVGKTFDVIIANINRNILLQDIPVYASILNEGGILFLSGFYKEDIPMLTSRCQEFGLSFVESKEKDNWVALKYVN